MSKGSNRRPGTGYGAGYDGIDWGRTAHRIEVAGDTVFGLDPSKTYRTEVAKDGSVSYWEIEPQQVQDVAIDIAIQKYGTYPGKVWYIQPDGSLLPADGGTPLVQAKTCQHCKHWAPDFISNKEACHNIILIDMMESKEYARFESPADFGCNRWEAKI